MIVQNIYHDCVECDHRQRLLSASPGYVVTVEGFCERCKQTLRTAGIVTPFSVDLVPISDPNASSGIFADQVRNRLTKFEHDDVVQRFEKLLGEDFEAVSVRNAVLATMLFLAKERSSGQFTARPGITVRYVKADLAQERAEVINQIIDGWERKAAHTTYDAS